jgi:hypothetical protein
MTGERRSKYGNQNAIARILQSRITGKSEKQPRQNATSDRRDCLMDASWPIQIPVMGPAGVGKSHLDKLTDLPGWDPYRVRPPRTADDKAMDKNIFNDLLVKGDVKDNCWKRGHLLYPHDGQCEKIIDGNEIRRIYEKSGLCICTGWSFFKVRGADQCLNHAEYRPDRAMRIEIFAPVLIEMIRHRRELVDAFDLRLENFLVIILNPTSLSFADSPRPSIPLQLATAMAVVERDRVHGKAPDLGDSMRRVDHLHDELKAWRAFIKNRNIATLECLRWHHFEFRYHANEAGELPRAKNSLLDAIRNHPFWGEEEKARWTTRLERRMK